MLVLSRKIGEQIIVGREVVVGVARVARNRVYLSIEAPENISVDRKEIWLAKRQGICGDSTVVVRKQGRISEDARNGKKDGCRKCVDLSVATEAISMLNRSVNGERQKQDHDANDNCQGVVRHEERHTRPDAANIADVMDRLIADIQSDGGPEVEFYDDLPIDELPVGLQMVVFPIVQELLVNACRHSKSKNVLIGLGRDNDRICIQVEDWGVGFDLDLVRPHRKGLEGIYQLVQWNGGNVSIDSRSGAGTCVVIEIPLLEDVKNARPIDPECGRRKK